MSLSSLSSEDEPDNAVTESRSLPVNGNRPSTLATAGSIQPLDAGESSLGAVGVFALGVCI